MKGLLLVALLVALCAAVPTQLTYTLNANYVYNVSGIVQNNGYDTNVQDFVPGFYSFMSAVMVMQPIKEDDTSYYFVMNLFGTVVSVSNTSDGASPADPNGDSLGDDMYFTQLKTGQITEIQYYSDDQIYYVNVKLSAINAFQTSIVAVGSNQVVLESDPIGNHSAQVSGTAGGDGSLVLTKVFSQTDFSAFPDTTVTAQNMFINAQAVTGVHASGYIMNSTLTQAAIMTNGAPSSASKRTMTNTTGFDVQLSALGSLNVQYVSGSSAALKVFAAQRQDELIKSNMFEVAAKANVAAQARAYTLDVQDAIATILSNEAVPLSALGKVGNHFKYNPEDLINLVPLLEKANFLANPTLRDRLFFVLTMVQNQEYLIKYGLDSSNCAVVTRAVLAAAHFPTTDALEGALTRISAQASCPVAQGSAKTILQQTSVKVQDSDFPFNKSYDAGVNFGGKVAAAQFNASVFAGTNLNCNNPSFNYEAYAEGSATAILFGYSQEAFDAKVIYGQVNGATLADEITLSVWGKVVYDQPIPSLPCEQGSYPLAHIAPGFSVSHTLWVSIIPIIFSASANLDLSASWGWTLCASTLSAEIDVTGAGAIQLSGSTYTDLLLLRAGFDIEGSFSTTIVPQAYIHGTTCEIGFEIDAQNEPLTASLTSYYQWQTCKFLFFDCKWGKYNSQTWWSYNAPSKDLVLYKITFPIA